MHRSTNLEKYQTKNPVVQRLLGSYFQTLEELVRPLAPTSILDVGCGEGMTAARLRAMSLAAGYRGIDASPGAVACAREANAGLSFDLGDVYQLEPGCADVVLCLEVLEHLDDPGRAVKRLRAAARRAIVVSVPWEPWFRLGNLMRGKYVARLGNHPEHIQQFSPRTFRQLLAPDLGKVEMRTSFPWVFAWATVG